MKKLGITLTLALAILVCAWMVGANTDGKNASGPLGSSIPGVLVAPESVLASSAPKGPVVLKDGSLAMRVEHDNDHILQGGAADMFLRLELTADRSDTESSRPLNLALVIDRSGSMASRGKLNYARDAANTIVDLMEGDDRLAVVVYDDRAELLVPSTKVTDPEAIKALISKITDRGSTNLSGGMSLGQQQVKKYFDTEAINRVIILSDGLANRGITNRADLARLVSGWGEAGIRVTSMGLGADFDEDMMHELASASGGNYYFIESPNQLARIYEKELKTLALTAAKDVTITLKLADGVRLGEVYGYSSKYDRGKLTIPVGDMSGGQRRRVRVRLILPAEKLGKINVAEVRLDYRDALNGSKPVVGKSMVVAHCVRDRAKVSARLNKKIDTDRRVVHMNNDRYHAQNDLKNGDREKAVGWYEGMIKKFNGYADINENKELLKQRAILEDDLRKIKSDNCRGGECLSNRVKTDKLKSLGYMQ